MAGALFLVCTGGTIIFGTPASSGLKASSPSGGTGRYRSGRSRDWVKIKNPAHPAIERAMLIAVSKQRQRG